MIIAHTHPFNGPFSGTTRVSRYQKGKTNLDFTEARDSELQWHQLGHMQVCISLQTDNHASTTPLKVFLQAGCPSCRPTNSVKALYKSIFTIPYHTIPLNQSPDRMWRLPPGRLPNKWLNQLQNGSIHPDGDLWRRAVDCGHGGATTRRPALATMMMMMILHACGVKHSCF